MSDLDDVFDGPLDKRIFGTRIDDDVEVWMVGGDKPRVIRGRVLSYDKALQVVDEKGFYHKINYDWIVDLMILKHRRPPPKRDPEVEGGTPKEKTGEMYW